MYQISYCHTPSSLFFFHFPTTTPNSRPCYSSSADLSSVQILSPIIPHQQSRVQFLSYSISIDYSATPHQDTLYHINYFQTPSSSHVTPIRRPYSSSSAEPISDPIEVRLMSPPSACSIIQFHQSINQFQQT